MGDRNPAATAARWVQLRARSRWRQATSRWRALPDFLVIGAMKSGTSSLYAAMTDHPRIVWARKKELHFFDGPRAVEGARAYRTSFPLRRELRARRALTGEATATYVFEPAVLPAVRAMLPDVKLIVSVRDPVDRAISHYFHEVRDARTETLPFAEAIAAEFSRATAAEALLSAGAVPRHTFRGAYVARGMYADQLRAWTDVFPPEQLLVLVYEELVSAPAHNLAVVWDFLGIEDRPVELPHRNVGAKHAVDDDVVADLRERFRAPNEELADLLESVPVVRPPGPRVPAWAAHR